MTDLCFLPRSKKAPFFIMSALSEDVIWWLPSFFSFIFMIFFFPIEMRTGRLPF